VSLRCWSCFFYLSAFRPLIFLFLETSSCLEHWVLRALFFTWTRKVNKDVIVNIRFEFSTVWTMWLSISCTNFQCLHSFLLPRSLVWLETRILPALWSAGVTTRHLQVSFLAVPVFSTWRWEFVSVVSISFEFLQYAYGTIHSAVRHILLKTVEANCLFPIDNGEGFLSVKSHLSVHTSCADVLIPYLPENRDRVRLRKLAFFRMLAITWLRELVTLLSPRRPGFVPRPIHVGFVIDKMALRQVFPNASVFSR